MSYFPFTLFSVYNSHRKSRDYTIWYNTSLFIRLVNTQLPIAYYIPTFVDLIVIFLPALSLGKTYTLSVITLRIQRLKDAASGVNFVLIVLLHLAQVLMTLYGFKQYNLHIILSALRTHNLSDV